MPLASWAADLSEITRALAERARPLVIGAFLSFFRGEVGSLLKRLREASVPGGEFKFDAQLDRLAGDGLRFERDLA